MSGMAVVPIQSRGSCGCFRNEQEVGVEVAFGLPLMGWGGLRGGRFVRCEGSAAMHTPVTMAWNISCLDLSQP